MTEQPTETDHRAWRRRAGLVVLVAVAFACGWWAAVETLGRPADPAADEPDHVPYTVVEDTVGASVTLTGIARTPAVDGPAIRVGGVVTSVDLVGQGIVDSGQRLLTVDLRPIVLVAGEVPAFRDLSVGISGPDVRQLQQYLTEAGYLDGTPDGDFDEATRAAVRRWQEDAGGEVDGEVELGTVLFVAGLPRPIALADWVSVGATAQPDQPVVRLLDVEPELTVTLAAEQRDLAPRGTAAVVNIDGAQLSAEVVDVREDQQGQLELVLGRSAGRSLCADHACDGLVGPAPVEVPVELVSTPFETGPTLPISALFTTVDGDVQVELADGRTVPVSVRSSADGLAVVDGVDIGDTVRIPVTDHME